ncbi:MAG: 3-hydroxyacyl-CoA dehydrogenase family protein [Gemmatimonadota bacterium]
MTESASSITTVAVIGAGAMGRGIAQVAAQTGYATALCDADPQAPARARTAIEETLAKGVARGKLDAEARVTTLGRLRLATDVADAVAGADLVIEAIPERLELKRALFAELDARAAPHAILASNTSSLPIGALAAATGRPGRVLGLHFFNPVHLMQLVEIVVLPETEPAAQQAAIELVLALGKTPIVVRDVPGFATSRLGLAIGLEAMRMLEEHVASAADIDTAMELGYNHPMGPLKLTDLVGLDVRLAIAEHLAATLDPVRFAPPAILRARVAAGKLGRKAGEGFYRWENGEPRPLDGDAAS